MDRIHADTVVINQNIEIQNQPNGGWDVMVRQSNNSWEKAAFCLTLDDALNTPLSVIRKAMM